ncbi:hypothetical protein [Hymenobacter chitinivorans]|uniref:Lipoprotein n=1 Tax=Hymenobacter chitinivorans DSM 11115 TaxID=1121954 RepID=A0A2M9BNQ9_9BACT|nr:hypothetical protein [Hymenobacter chitinivorans]PJJ59591.1 hypothetical protein CLV45_1011 [Hymenobacter chitinivorans DSM 11115]
MKTSLLKLLISPLLLLGAAACEKESAGPEVVPEFYVRAQKNDQAWVVEGTGVYERATKKFYVFGYQSQPEAYLRLHFDAPTQSPAGPAEAGWSDLVGGDVLVNSYSSTGVAELPSVEITQLDTVQRIVEGRFQTTLRRDQRWSQQGELLQFRNGSFRVRYTIPR